MRNNRAMVVSTMCSLLLATAARAQTAPAASGHWQGEIQIPDRVLGVTVDLGRNAAGAWLGSLTVTGTTSVDVPLTGITVADAGVGFNAKLPEDTRFQGTMSADGKGLNGTVANAQGAVPFVLTRAGEANVKVPPPSSPLVKSFEGTWNGTIEVPGRTPMRLVLKISAAADGTAQATIVNLDQANEEISMTTVITTATTLKMETRAISGTYQGTLGPDGSIAGEWGQAGARAALTFRR